MFIRIDYSRRSMVRKKTMIKTNASPIHEIQLTTTRATEARFSIHDLKEYLARHSSTLRKSHFQNFYQIIWFRKGEGIHYVDFKPFEVFENAIFFIAKNQVHHFDHNSAYEGYIIHFNELFFGLNDNNINFLVRCSLFNNPFQTPSCCIGYGIEPILEEYIKQIKNELTYAEDTFGQEELLRTYLKSFLIQVHRRKIEFERQEGKIPFELDEKRELLIDFVNLVDTNFAKNLSVADYAAELNISTRTLSDLTTGKLQKTPSKIIQERIILEAQRMLLHSNYNINQIGYYLGFEDPSYFVKYFKKHIGISPSAFRKSSL